MNFGSCVLISPPIQEALVAVFPNCYQFRANLDHHFPALHQFLHSVPLTGVTYKISIEISHPQCGLMQAV